MNRRLRSTSLWLLLFALGAPAAAVADDDATWVKDFEAEEDNWPRLVGASFRIEGRYSVLGEASLRFRGCGLEFRYAPGVRRPNVDSLSIEVRGRLERDGNELFFDVTRIDEIPSDLERLRAKRGGIDGTDPEAWYELADWARQRGEFYDDDDLRAEAAILGRHGITTEYDRLGTNDGAGLRALSEKVRGMGLSDSLRMEYVHESLRRDFSAERSKPQPNYAVVLGNITQLLPGANVMLEPELRDEVVAAYEADPLTYYHDSDEPGRRRCHRAFYVDLSRRIILASAREDGSNGEAIAERIRGELPEFPELADEWELKSLEYEHSRVANLNRPEVAVLSQRFFDRGDHRRSEQVWRDWLRAREFDWRPSGAPGLMQLAEGYEELAHDEEQAAEYVLEAYDMAPTNEAVASWLREHDYVFVNGEWVPEGEAGDHPVSEMETAIREGRVREGMTREDVRRALGGGPSSMIRIASSRHITELWIYEEHRVSVRFVQNASRDDATVDEIKALSIGR